MIGGGIYTLAGVVLGVAGPFAWVSLLIGAILALITVRSYFRLTLRTKGGGVPITYLVETNRRSLAGVLSWWLILVYVLAMGVYSFTFGHYLGRALALSETAISIVVIGLLTTFVVLNIVGIKEPAGVQIAAVWIELLMLAALGARRRAGSRMHTDLKGDRHGSFPEHPKPLATGPVGGALFGTLWGTKLVSTQALSI